MKKSILIVATASFIALGSSFFTACNSNQEQATDQQEQTTVEAAYVCPMHPEVTSSEPGQCSKCGMDLVAVE